MSVPTTPTFLVFPPTTLARDDIATVVWNTWGNPAVDHSQVDVVDSSTGTTVYTTDVTTTAFVIDPTTQGIPAGSYYFKVTAHNSDGWSESAYASMTIVGSAIVTITAPTDGSTVTGLPLVVSWDVTDGTGVSEQKLTITDGDGYRVWPSIWTWYDDGSVTPGQTSVTLHASDMPGIVNGGEYTIALTVTNGQGATTTVTSEFTTSWTPPTMPTLSRTTANADDATVTVIADSPSSACDIIVWRVVDGTRVVVATGYERAEATDYMPPLGADFTYEAQATDVETGVTSDVQSRTVHVDARSWMLNFGTDASESIALWGNPSASRSLDQGGEAYHFADGGAGDGLPVWYGLDERDEGGSLSFDTDDPDDARQLFAMLRKYPVCWLRDPFGNRWRARVVPTVKHGVGQRWELSLSWDAMRWQEPEV